jgi:transcription elongation factor Elf1
VDPATKRSKYSCVLSCLLANSPRTPGYFYNRETKRAGWTAGETEDVTDRASATGTVWECTHCAHPNLIGAGGMKLPNGEQVVACAHCAHSISFTTQAAPSSSRHIDVRNRQATLLQDKLKQGEISTEEYNSLLIADAEARAMIHELKVHDPADALKNDLSGMRLSVSGHLTEAEHTSYVVSCEAPATGTWTVNRRFSQFDKFHQRLKSMGYFGVKLPFPTKWSFGKSESSVSKRQGDLDEFMQSVLSAAAQMDASTLTEIAVFISYHKQASVAEELAAGEGEAKQPAEKPIGFLDSIDLSG